MPKAMLTYSKIRCVVVKRQHHPGDGTLTRIFLAGACTNCHLGGLLCSFRDGSESTPSWMDRSTDRWIDGWANGPGSESSHRSPSVFKENDDPPPRSKSPRKSISLGFEYKLMKLGLEPPHG